MFEVRPVLCVKRKVQEELSGSESICAGREWVLVLWKCMMPAPNSSLPHALKLILVGYIAWSGIPCWKSQFLRPSYLYICCCVTNHNCNHLQCITVLNVGAFAHYWLCAMPLRPAAREECSKFLLRDNILPTILLCIKMLECFIVYLHTEAFFLKKKIKCSLKRLIFVKAKDQIHSTVFFTSYFKLSL